MIPRPPRRTVTERLDDEDRADGGEEWAEAQPAGADARGPAPKPPSLGRTLTFFQQGATPAAWRALAVAVMFALLYAAGTAALSLVAHWLAKPDAHNALSLRAALLALAVFALRPLFYVCHVDFVLRAMLLADRTALGATGRAKPILMQMISTFVILTRDLPPILILLGVMGWTAGGIGLVLAAIALAGLGVSGPTRRLAQRHYGTRRIVALLPDEAMAHGVARRGARAWAEAASALLIALIVMALAMLKLAGHLPSEKAVTTVVLSMLLLQGPLRRIARLLAGGGDE